MAREKKSSSSNLPFAASRELRAFVAEHFERWKRKNYGGVELLADRCGVSSQYMSQVLRYGRIPAKSILILLALNLDLDDPHRLLSAAGIREPWPFEEEVRLGKISKHDSGFLSVKIDMDGFSTAIREIVRAETKPQPISEILGNKPLKIGLYVGYYWLYDSRPTFGEPIPPGILPEFCRLLGVSLQRDVSIELLPFPRHLEEFRKGTIDLFGPMMVAPRGGHHTLFTTPLQKVGLSVLIRKKPSKDLTALPYPASINDLIAKPYKIAVLRDSLPHLIANTKLQKSDEELIVVDSDDEAIDRMLVKGVKRGAHLYLANSLIVHDIARRYLHDFELLFDTTESLLDMADIAFAVRPELEALMPQINQSISFLLDRGGFRERISSRLRPELGQLAGL